MPPVIAPRRRLFSANRRTVFVEYTSLALLVAIAAIAVLTQIDGDGELPRSTRTTSVN